MLILKTCLGNFGNYKDLYRFMLDEEIDNIEITVEYIFDKIITSTVTLEDIKELAGS